MTVPNPHPGICRAIAPPVAEACGNSATHRVTFCDGDMVVVCQECALRLDLLAQSHGTILRVERMEQR